MDSIASSYFVGTAIKRHAVTKNEISSQSTISFKTSEFHLMNISSPNLLLNTFNGGRHVKVPNDSVLFLMFEFESNQLEILMNFINL